AAIGAAVADSGVRFAGAQNVVFQGRRLVRRRVALDDLAVAAHQELGEVPLNGLGAQHAGVFTLHPAVQRVGVGAVDLGLGAPRVREAILRRAEIATGSLVAGFLVAELVARNP